MLKNLLKITACFGMITLLTGCFPPTFYSIVNLYAVDDGSDVPFILSVGNSATSVTCFNGSVIMSNTGGDTWQGTADYTNDLGGTPGSTTVNCTAINNFGSITSAVGQIILVENQLPVVTMLPTVTICPNDGSLNIDEPLIDFSNSSYLTGASYTKFSGDLLDTGLSISSTTGNLIGNPAAGDINPTGIVIRATTAAGSGDSAAFDINILEFCP